MFCLILEFAGNHSVHSYSYLHSRQQVTRYWKSTAVPSSKTHPRSCVGFLSAISLDRDRVLRAAFRKFNPLEVSSDVRSADDGNVSHLVYGFHVCQNLLFSGVIKYLAPFGYKENIKIKPCMRRKTRIQRIPGASITDDTQNKMS